MTHLRLDWNTARYRALAGVGGIGAGSFFAVNENHTLGREESRSGRFVDRRDYCKLHIISHYVAVLLGPDFLTQPIGFVGDDDSGRRLLGEMSAVGMDMSLVSALTGERTLTSFCIVYPDGAGCNLTTDDSACSRVDAGTAGLAQPVFARFRGKCVALAVPEVPLCARAELLALATEHACLRVASFTAEEIAGVLASGWLSWIDLLAVNRDEAAAIAGVSPDSRPPEELARQAVAQIFRRHPRLALAVTAGAAGSWCWDGRVFNHVPAIPVGVVSTAGAGDAFLAGIICGLVAGIPLPSAQRLGTMVAALSVTSPHTINTAIDRPALVRLLETTGFCPTPDVGELVGALKSRAAPTD